VEIRFLGHAAFEISDGDARVLIDPFLAPDNPAAAVGPDEVDPTNILLTHGHGDHITHAVEIAKRTGASCLAITELARWLSAQGVEDVADPNLGGTIDFDWGWVRLVPALHTNSLSDEQVIGVSAGLVIGIGDTTIYHLGDTCLFSDLGLVAARTPVNVALIPIGGHYTMDQDDAVIAAELIDADTVIPMHYDTFPPVEADPERFKTDVEASKASSEVVILRPGESYSP
jgi:L-ascorbate metabolism protein UlaG (beta-lactamase superfamily)